MDQALHSCDYNRMGVEGHIATGHTLDPEGTQDHLIYHDLRIVLEKIDIVKLRLDMKAEIDAVIQADPNKLWTWKDVQNLHMIEPQALPNENICQLLKN